MSKIFISHSSRDTQSTADTMAALQSWGFEDRDIFLDYDAESGIIAGSSWERSLQENLQSARFVVCIVSKNWLASDWCRAEYRTALLSGKSIVCLVAEDCEHGSFGASAQKVLLYANAADGFTKLERAITEAGLHPTRSLLKFNHERGPYPGLVSFEEEDAAVFFGREVETNRLVEQVTAARLGGAPARFIMILGASGSGKSSLMRAGLIPRLRLRDRDWSVVHPFRPGFAPVRSLAQALHETAVNNGCTSNVAEWQSAAHEMEASAFWRFARSAFKAAPSSNDPPRTLALVVDQFEEALRADGQEVERFAKLLAANQTDDIVVVATVRTDSFHEFQLSAAFKELSPALFSLTPIPPQEIATVIRNPARVAGLEFDEEAIRQAAEDAPSGDTLPLLAFTLNRLWQDHRHIGKVTLRDYQATGGVVGTIRHAWEMVRRLTRESEAGVIATFIPRLATVSPNGEYVRRRSALAEFNASQSKIVDQLVAHRLLIVGSEEDGTNFVEVSHEAVLRALPQLTSTLSKRREDISLIAEAEDLQRRYQDANPHEKPGVLWSISADSRRVLRDFASEPGWRERLSSVEPVLTGYDQYFSRLNAVLLITIALCLAVVVTDRPWHYAPSYLAVGLREFSTVVATASIFWLIFFGGRLQSREWWSLALAVAAQFLFYAWI